MKVKLNWFAIFVGILATLISLIVVLEVGKKDIDWNKYEQATSMMEDKGFNFNEKVEEGSVIRQPWNTVSSLYYVFVGAFLIALPYTPKTKEIAITSSKSLRILFGLAVIITGLGSAFMHMSMIFRAQFFDVAGMYLISVFIVMYAFRNVKKFTTTIFTVSYIIINALLLWSLEYAPELRRNLFLVLILVGLILEYALNRKVKGFTVDMLFAAASSLGFAYIIWQLDNFLPFSQIRGIFFEQTGFFQGHSFWHLLGATACGVIYLHYSRTYKAAHPELAEAETKKEKAAV